MCISGLVGIPRWLGRSANDKYSESFTTATGAYHVVAFVEESVEGFENDRSALLEAEPYGPPRLDKGELSERVRRPSAKASFREIPERKFVRNLQQRCLGHVVISIPVTFVNAPSRFHPAALTLELRYESPVAFRTQVHCSLCRVHDLGNIIASTCFEQEYTDLRVLGQAARHYRAGRA